MTNLRERLMAATQPHATAQQPLPDSNNNQADTVQITESDALDIQEMFSGMLNNESQTPPDFDASINDVTWPDEYEEAEEDEEDEEDEEENNDVDAVTQNQGSQQQDTSEFSTPIIRSRIAAEATSRFSGAMWYDKIANEQVTIVGQGGIGSWTSLLISRLGVRSLLLYDDDIVELGNLSGQFYSTEDVDKYKVDAVANAITKYSYYHNTTVINAKFDTGSLHSDIVIACLDSMEARKTVFYTWLTTVRELPQERRKECLFIDGRLAAETLQVFAVSGDCESDWKRYENTLFNDREADSEICSYKQTSFMANMIASVITNVFVNFVASGLDGGAAREIPFKTEYLGEMMWLKTDI